MNPSLNTDLFALAQRIYSRVNSPSAPGTPKGASAVLEEILPVFTGLTLENTSLRLACNLKDQVMRSVYPVSDSVGNGLLMQAIESSPAAVRDEAKELVRLKERWTALEQHTVGSAGATVDFREVPGGESRRVEVWVGGQFVAAGRTVGEAWDAAMVQRSAALA
jgi:hypothetical protein